MDIIIDETYAPDPTVYHLTAFLQTYNLTKAEVAHYKWLGSNPKVHLVPAWQTDACSHLVPASNIGTAKC